MDQTEQDFIQLPEHNTTAATMDDIETGQRRRIKTDSSGQYFSTVASDSNEYGIALMDHRHASADRTNNTSDNNNSNVATHPPKSFTQQFSAFTTMSMPYFRTSTSGKKLFTLMIILTLLNSAIRVYFSYLARDFWNALSNKDPETFYNIMVTFCAAMVGLTPISVGYRYVRQMLAIDWREWMTLRVLGLFMRNRAYYALERGCYGGIGSTTETANVDGDTASFGNGTSASRKKEETVDNPDQRISEDIRSFTEYSLSLFLTTLTAVIDLVSFSFILFTIMPRLFIAIFGFASLGTILTICIGKKLISLN
jgi:putative ATP-binding cassette transporter